MAKMRQRKLAREDACDGKGEHKGDACEYQAFHQGRKGPGELFLFCFLLSLERDGRRLFIFFPPFQPLTAIRIHFEFHSQSRLVRCKTSVQPHHEALLDL